MANKKQEDNVIYFDFTTRERLDAQEHARRQIMRIDPVLAKVQTEVSPQQFATYQSVVDDWLRRSLEYQLNPDPANEPLS